MNTNTGPELTLYTNHGCGWCHRVHILLKETNLPYNEVLVDLDKPRPEWFLKINPRGLVPALHYKDANIDTILVESALIVQFLIQLHPSHLTPSLGTPSDTAHFRYRMAFFVDTYFNKVNPLMFKLLGAADTNSQEEKIDEMVAVVEKEIEPLLLDANPYFGAKTEMTLAEVLVTPFVLRLYDFADDVIWPSSLIAKLDQIPAFSKWAKHAMKQESVTYMYDKELRRQRIHERLPLAKAKYAN